MKKNEISFYKAYLFIIKDYDQFKRALTLLKWLIPQYEKSQKV